MEDEIIFKDVSEYIDEELLEDDDLEIEGYVEEAEGSIFKKFEKKILKKVYILLVILGIIIFAVGYIDEGEKIKCIGDIVGIYVLVFTTLCGLHMFISFAIIEQRKYKRCNVGVEAKIRVLGMSSSYNGRGSTSYHFTCVFIYYYEGREYKVKAYKSAYKCDAYIDGESRVIFINPKLPSEIVIKEEYSKGGNIFLSIIGLLIASPFVIIFSLSVVIVILKIILAMLTLIQV